MSGNNRTNDANRGNLSCQIIWDGVIQAMAMLPAVPQIGSRLILEHADDRHRRSSFLVADVSMTVRPMDPMVYIPHINLPHFPTTIQVFVKFEGPSPEIPPFGTQI